jgi:ferredoxin
MDFQLRNLIFANLAVIAFIFLAFLQNPLTGYIVLAAVVLTDVVMVIQYLRKRAQRQRTAPAVRYQIELLRERCIGQGNCLRLAPASFALDAEQKVVLLRDDDDPRVVLDAARACPVDAIFLYDAAGKQVYPEPDRPWQKKRLRPVKTAGPAEGAS